MQHTPYSTTLQLQCSLNSAGHSDTTEGTQITGDSNSVNTRFWPEPLLNRNNFAQRNRRTNPKLHTQSCLKMTGSLSLRTEDERSASTQLKNRKMQKAMWKGTEKRKFNKCRIFLGIIGDTETISWDARTKKTQRPYPHAKGCRQCT